MESITYEIPFILKFYVSELWNNLFFRLLLSKTGKKRVDNKTK